MARGRGIHKYPSTGRTTRGSRPVIVWVIGLVDEELERFKDWETRHGAQALAAVESDARAAGVAQAEQTSAFGWAVFGLRQRD